MIRPLEGITVVSLEQAVAAPFAARQLADLGARVIKIERPESGDFARHYDQTVNGMSSHFTWLNRSKESVEMDLKGEDSKELLLNMLEKADVFLYNLAPGAVDRLGFSPDTLKEKFPRLITCSITGYGENGSYRNKKAYDLLIQCEAGAVSVTGTEETPSKAGISIADIAAGMYAYSGIMAAVIARSVSGKGTHLDISMLEALGEWMGYPLYYAGYGGSEPKRTGASHATIYPYGPFTTGEGKQVFLGIQNDREWKAFCSRVIGKPELAEEELFSTNALRVKNQEELALVIASVFEKMTAEELTEKLDEMKIANAKLNTMKDFMEHPQLKERNRWTTIDSPAGDIQTLLPPITAPGFKITMGDIPELGEHNEKIRKEFGTRKK
ncbi:CaiB/BaiF CoA transferase family protein [Alkalicoccus saliphilus]|uniref:CaiB/BaiF CoA transferase family protein n=1 Tax=Alkalicoccus saliphilus TaxID=200989 RepID=UPI001FE70F4F|nr:CaiB/BaiF CoA-transferase family protein [Alkalicoccus saliphilus]